MTWSLSDRSDRSLPRLEARLLQLPAQENHNVIISKTHRKPTGGKKKNAQGFLPPAGARVLAPLLGVGVRRWGASAWSPWWWAQPPAPARLRCREETPAGRRPVGTSWGGAARLGPAQGLPAAQRWDLGLHRPGWEMGSRNPSRRAGTGGNGAGRKAWVFGSV